MTDTVLSQSTRVAADLATLGVEAGRRAFDVTRHHGLLLQTRVRAHASGRPGPRAVTGDYRRSIGLQMRTENGNPVAAVGSSRPQARRLEFGFHGVDSIGRSFNQVPLPHFGPALDETIPGFEAGIAGIVDELTGR